MSNVIAHVVIAVVNVVLAVVQLSLYHYCKSTWFWHLRLVWWLIVFICVCLCSPAGLRAGDEILILNGMSVSSLDLGLMQAYFGQPSVSLVLWREEAVSDEPSTMWPDCESSEAYRPTLAPAQAHHMEHFPPWPSGKTPPLKPT